MIVFIRLTFANTGDEVYYEGVCHYRHQLSSVLNVTPAIICRLSLDNTPLGLHCGWARSHVARGARRPLDWRLRFMPMTMAGEVQLAANRETVWEKLNDPDVLKVCIPGCEELVRSADNQLVRLQR